MKLYQRAEKLMGTAFSLGILAETESQAQHFLQMGIDEIKRTESLLSEFIPQSATSQINQLSPLQSLSLEEEVYQLLKRCQAISRLCKGDFDITVSPLKKLYRFKNDDFEMPDASTISSCLKSVGFHKIELDDTNRSIKLLESGMAISFAAIGKGYAADKVVALWKTYGINAGFVNASGDIRAWGLNTESKAWNVGIAHPNLIEQSVFKLQLKDNAIATSGNSEQHFIWQGKRYSHNINPHTGYPLMGIKSVTIVSPSAELSDALATAVYVKGVEKGIAFVNQLPQTHAIIITETDEVFFSKQIEYEVLSTTDHPHTIG